jgi:hypothetical protein
MHQSRIPIKEYCHSLFAQFRSLVLEILAVWTVFSLWCKRQSCTHLEGRKFNKIRYLSKHPYSPGTYSIIEFLKFS